MELLNAEPGLKDYLTVFRNRHPGRQLRVLKRLRVMVRDYPRKPLLDAIRTARNTACYGAAGSDGIETNCQRLVRAGNR